MRYNIIQRTIFSEVFEMALSAKTIRKQLNILKPIIGGFSLKTIRKWQNRIGELMELQYRGQTIQKKHDFEAFEGAWIIPKDERREGVILYLHGGGYVCGDLGYATGFGSVLAVQSGARVFCAAYRLAPEAPFPAALDDALCAYEYLLEKGYRHITVCGESAGGGLCYSLCLKLREKGLPLPCGIIAISPWTDLTASGESYRENEKNDPSMTAELLEFFAENYTSERENPLVSPLFADLHDLPPSLIFVGGDEIMLSDAKLMHERLRAAKCKSRLVVAKERWHAYPLYGLEEDKKDFSLINQFLNHFMSKENRLRWLPLDNSAKIYPPACNQNWSNVFRVSATLKEQVDTVVMRSALDVTVRRFPSIAVRLRRGVFWYYLQQLAEVPEIREESSYPLTRMTKEEMRKCAFRIIVYERRVAIEIFHSITDGSGALIFLKSLLAEYLLQKHGVHIPAEQGVLGRLEEPSEEELEDSYQKYIGNVSASLKASDAWRLSGTPETHDFLHLTCLELPVKDVLAKAHEYGVSLTNFMCAVMMQALQELQAEKVPNVRKRKPIKVFVPVNLRNLFESRSLRNFVLYATPEILPKLGTYSFEEICKIVNHQMALEITGKQMSMKIATNTACEHIWAFKIMPLFIKNLAMKAVFNSVGERKSCLAFSNLGAVKMPEEMMNYIERMDFILGVQATAPYDCAMLSFGDTLYINFIRNIKESELEYAFYRVLRELGLRATVQSNNQGK
ncbi:MAG: alpha/beta hydrolase fold domain-containing protein [Clostridia bacterium]|nr:alpha/beta hydrolase fold domain-containing protein [Clostridia bacterium]